MSEQFEFSYIYCDAELHKENKMVLTFISTLNSCCFLPDIVTLTEIDDLICGSTLLSSSPQSRKHYLYTVYGGRLMV